MLEPGCRDEPQHRVPLPSRVTATEFSPFEWSASLLAIGFQSSITLATLWLPEEGDRGELEFKVVQEVHHDTRVQAIAWSPATSLTVAPKSLEFATSGTDHRLRLYSSDTAEVSVKVLRGHTDYINSIVYEPEKGEVVVTGSDDHTVKVWSGGECRATLHYQSPVMTVAWHHQDLGKLLVAQKAGVVQLVNSASLQPILSVDCGVSPLLAADWCASNSLLLAAAVSMELVQFDLSRPSVAAGRRAVHSEGARLVRWSRGTDQLVATAGRPGNCLKVLHAKSAQAVVTAQQAVVGGLSWHLRLPYLAVGGDRELAIYRVSF